MIHIKTPEEIAFMQHGGHILAEALFATLAQIKPGVTEIELDAFAEKFIRKAGGEPGFMRVPGYHHTICVSTNDVVVHGIPTNRILQEGDIIGIDMGVFYKGFHTDMAETVLVKNPISPAAARSRNSVDKIKNPNTEVVTFLATGKMAMEEGIRMAKPGNHVGHISKAMQDIIEKQGKFSVVRSLVGHGVGRELHEEPEIPGYLAREISKTPVLRVGMTIAVEIIYNMGKRDVTYTTGDDWTIVSKDGSLAGLFERSLVITESGPMILTK